MNVSADDTTSNVGVMDERDGHATSSLSHLPLTVTTDILSS
jgi:hypothetical protein